jgi:hypothetical protein
VGAESRRDPEAPNVRGSEDELAVRREGFRPVDEPDHLHLGEIGDTYDGVLHQLLEAGPVFLEELRIEIGRYAVEPPRLAVALVTAHDEPS